MEEIGSEAEPDSEPMERWGRRFSLKFEAGSELPRGGI